MVDENEQQQPRQGSQRRRRAATRPAGPPSAASPEPTVRVGEVHASDRADAGTAELVLDEPQPVEQDALGAPTLGADADAPVVGSDDLQADADAPVADADESDADEADALVAVTDADLADADESEADAPVAVADADLADADLADAVESEADAPVAVAEANAPVANTDDLRASPPLRSARPVTIPEFSAESTTRPIQPPRARGELPPTALFQPPDRSLALRPAANDDEDVEVAAAEAVLDEREVGLQDDEAGLLSGVDAGQVGGSEGDEGEADDDLGSSQRRRRRRGGRRRRRAGGEAPDGEESDGPADLGAPADEEAEAIPPLAVGSDADADSEEDADDESSGARRRRRRRRRAGVAMEMEDLSVEDPPNTVVKVREGRRASDEITALRGSTRIEAKRQRRRDGREAGRRRAPILTEAEFLARREAVERVMCVRQDGGRTQIAVLEDGVLVEHYVNRSDSSSTVGNVFLGKVQNVLPSMEAAFVDIGRGRNAVLYAGEVNWDAAGLEGQPKRIELALKAGDSVLVQVTKDPIGHKGARLTSQISLPGRFLVYVPEGSMTGISRKLPDTERSRLKAILKDVLPEEAGVIVRTAAEGASEEQLTSDVRRLEGQWSDIKRKAKSASAPALLYGEPDLAIKVVRDIFNEDFASMKVQGAGAWEVLSDYIARVAPDLVAKVSLWVESTDLYAAHRIDEQLAKALDRKVWLPSGGSLVIDRTEAMTVIDVNTGKFTGQGGTLEETVTRNNLEAAEEIVRQLRLRDIGGIVVIDFIDMVLESNRDLVLRRLVECLGRDRTKHQVAEVTSLGLVQMTRKRLGQGLLEAFSTPCEHCAGRGYHVSLDTDVEPVDEANHRRAGDRSGRRGSRRTPTRLGGMQTGKTPPPPKFDQHGHIESAGGPGAGDLGEPGADEIDESGESQLEVAALETVLEAHPQDAWSPDLAASPDPASGAGPEQTDGRPRESMHEAEALGLDPVSPDGPDLIVPDADYLVPDARPGEQAPGSSGEQAPGSATPEFPAGEAGVPSTGDSAAAPADVVPEHPNDLAPEQQDLAPVAAREEALVIEGHGADQPSPHDASDDQHPEAV